MIRYLLVFIVTLSHTVCSHPSFKTDIQTSFGDDGGKTIVTLPIVNNTDDKLIIVGSREFLGGNMQLFGSDGNETNELSLIVQNPLIDLDIGSSKSGTGKDEWHAKSVAKIIDLKDTKLGISAESVKVVDHNGSSQNGIKIDLGLLHLM